jgi:hypothetical protein
MALAVGLCRIQMERIVPKFSLPLIASCSVLAAITTVSVAQATSFPQDLPMGIICSSPNGKTWVVGYIQSIKENGDAIYQASGGRLNATVNAARLLVPPSDRPSGSDCYGKTLDELRAMDHLIPFQKMPAKQ